MMNGLDTGKCKRFTYKFKMPVAGNLKFAAAINIRRRIPIPAMHGIVNNTVFPTVAFGFVHQFLQYAGA
jgi:hypothetical protein